MTEAPYGGNWSHYYYYYYYYAWFSTTDWTLEDMEDGGTTTLRRGFLLSTTIAQVILSPVIFLANVLLLIAILRVPELRSLSFYHVAMMAASDCIVAIANLFRVTVNTDPYGDYGIFPREFKQASFNQFFQTILDTKLHVFGFFIRAIVGQFNQNFTCICSLAMAFDRYVLVCKASDANQLLSRKRRILSCVVSTCLIVMLVAVDVAITYTVEIYDNRLYHQNALARIYFDYGGIIRCMLLYFVPVTVSAGLYLQIGRRLANMKSNATRNTQLTKAFAITCAAWAILWFPGAVREFENFAYTHYEILDLRYMFSKESFNTIWERSLDFRMLYSALNPLLFLFITKSIQKRLKKLMCLKC